VSPPTPTLSLIAPDDWHVHLRDGAALASVVPDTARRFARAIVMPNLVPPVASTARALAYRERILKAVPTGVGFDPLMTLYLTDRMAVDEVRRARASGSVVAVKLYPAGATTHSDAGVRDLAATYPVLEAMAREGLPLLVHGEATEPEVDVFDRERVFVERTLAPLVRRFPGLRVVLEHVSTREGVDFVREGPPTLAATVTAHHLLLNRNALFTGGIRPHHYCLPVVKREEDRQALVAAATSGHPRFFLGTDSAPHARSRKESGRGPAGIYTAHAAIELYAEAFEQAGALDRLEAFASLNGPAFYGLEPNAGRITLVRELWTVPESVPFGDGALVPFRAGESVAWRIAP
jgi:dihydroorotase